MSKGIHPDIEHILRSFLELHAGTYKRMSSKKRLEGFYKAYNFMKSAYKQKNSTIVNTFNVETKIGNNNKIFNKDMKPITIKEMELGNTHSNRYIKLEIITEILIMTGLAFIAKDDNQDLITVGIYNFENHYRTRDYQKLKYIFQKGKYILSYFIIASKINK